ncbi:putative F-box protein At1g65770 [Lotus japonicus]|uniref:putative F-box protein At1g65770 n=1 Tax=Lotus japonicus TaxID=34305 RepID=UPI002589176E|nr:putative F-box protein At1g65770 [Lotus japonicus]
MAPLTLPYLILPSDFVEAEDGTYTTDRIIFNVSENKLFKWTNMFKEHEAGAWCAGSSHGWLFMLDTRGCPFLLNPSSSKCFYLAPFSKAFMESSAGITHSCFVENSLKTFVTKVALMCSPSPSQHTVAILFSYPGKLAFCIKPSTWVELTGGKGSYLDIVFQDTYLYALTEDGTVEIWNFLQQVPTMVADFKPTMDSNDEEEGEFLGDGFSWKMYLVISEGELLLVKRFLGDFVNAAGEVVYEGYQSPDGGDEICPYKTKDFVVYKLDPLSENKWEKKGSLGDRVLFLGTNESVSRSANELQGCEANSIYFTDDRWEEMNGDYSYGGHDWGVFSLQDKIFKTLAECPNKLDPPPVWIV